MCKKRVFALAAGLAFCAVPASALTLTESTFVPGSVTQVTTYTSGATQTGSQVGAPGAPAFQVLTVGGGGTRNAWFFDGLSYDPSGGAVTSLDMSFSYANAEADGRKQGLGFVLRQDGDFYISSTGGPAQPGGVFALTDVQPDDLTRVQGIATRAGAPDFSLDGPRMDFGLYTFNGSGNDIRYVYDDFTVSLDITPVPVPAGFGLLLAALGGLGAAGLRKRRAR
jgi:hypothetical protein